MRHTALPQCGLTGLTMPLLTFPAQEQFVRNFATAALMLNPSPQSASTQNRSSSTPMPWQPLAKRARSSSDTIQTENDNIRLRWLFAF
jgi:hypothetical protein